MIEAIALGLSLIDFFLSNWVKVCIGVFFLYVIIKINSINAKVLRLEGELNSKKVNEVIDERFNYSLTNIYNDKELLGHEWTYKVEDGHWATAIYDELSKKFIVKHFRTHENTNANDVVKRIDEDMAHNKQFVYGDNRPSADVSGMENKNGIYVPKG
jgi:hypothetical protein